MDRIFVIILTYNSAATIDRLLKSCLPLKRRFKFIVIDNKSKDETAKIVKKYKWVKLIENRKNIGYAGGNNTGIKYALSKKSDAVFVLNPDTVLSKGFASSFEKSTINVLQKKEVGIIGPKILDGKGNIWSLGGKIDKKRYSSILTKTKTRNPDYITGTAMFVKKEVFEKVGLLNEDYFLYYEDVDFCQRALRSGFKLVVDPGLVITHFESSTVGKNSPTMQYYLARNHMLFVKRFAPWKIKAREFIRLPKTIKEAKSKYELLGILDYLLGRGGKNAYWN